jgi:hypothetical protein
MIQERERSENEIKCAVNLQQVEHGFAGIFATRVIHYRQISVEGLRIIVKLQVLQHNFIVPSVGNVFRDKMARFEDGEIDIILKLRFMRTTILRTLID